MSFDLARQVRSDYEHPSSIRRQASMFKNYKMEALRRNLVLFALRDIIAANLLLTRLSFRAWNAVPGKA